MRTLDAQAPTTPSDGAVFDHEPWMGEPPTDFQKSEGDDWLRQIEGQLDGVDVLKLLDDEWLKPTGIGDRLAPLIKAFRARGGRVEYAKTT
jgi:hypothetical protein